MTTTVAEERQLKMRYAGGLVRHLGLQMYAGIVPALAELVANSWDADATEVHVEVPFRIALNDQSEIRVRDNGVGMTFDEVNDAYLVLGRDRRASGGLFSQGGRRVMGRKGIGKLAGFGIAHLMQVYTVKQCHLTAFEMDYDEIIRQAGGDLVRDYEPKILEDHPVAAGDELQEGTLIILRRLQRERAVSEDVFTRGMRRRFSILGEQFRVFANGDRVEPAEGGWQFRFPDDGLQTEQVEGLGTVQWWAGFTETPIPYDDARGIAVLAHGKLVQRPFFFELSGGVQGQHGMQYLTGEVIADGLDEDRDLIATDRAGILWEDPLAAPLLRWGQKLVRRLLRDWSSGRQEENDRRIQSRIPTLTNLDRLPERVQTELRKAATALASIDTLDQARLEELITFLVRAYDSEHFMTLVRELNSADAEVSEQLVRLFKEWDVQEAVNLAWIVRGRLEIIARFESMIGEKAREKPDMQDFVKTHPWLLDPAWDVLRHEISIDRLVTKDLGIKLDTDQGARRLDFFTLADAGMAVIVEVKRPGISLTRDHVRQCEDYVNALRRAYDQETDETRKRRVQGILIGSDLKSDDRNYFDNAAQSQIYARTWRGLLENTQRLHRDYLAVVRARAPTEDPRLDGIDNLVRGESEAHELATGKENGES